MSTPIKPPGGGGPPRGIDAPKGKDAVSKAPSDEFRKTLDLRRPAPAAPVAQPVATDAVQRIAAQVRAGELDAARAVEQLVERAMSSGAASTLAPAQRRELEALLRSAVESDPTLAAMVKDLERGR